MNHTEHHKLVEIITGEPFKVRLRLQEFLDSVVVEEPGKSMEESISLEQTRTDQQNKALHVWFQAVADECNKHGVDAKLVMSKVMRMDMTPAFIKEMWKTLQRALYGKTSTTQLRKNGEIDKIRDHFIRFFANEFELELPPFPGDTVEPSAYPKVRNTTTDYPAYNGAPTI